MLSGANNPLAGLSMGVLMPMRGKTCELVKPALKVAKRHSQVVWRLQFALNKLLPELVVFFLIAYGAIMVKYNYPYCFVTKKFVVNISYRNNTHQNA